MKLAKLIFIISFAILKFWSLNSFAQVPPPSIVIDGNANLINGSNGIPLPYWLKAGQTLAAGQNVYSISGLEFTITGSALDFSQVLKVTTVQTVPTGKAWKIESYSQLPPNLTTGTTTYTVSGTFSVPIGVNQVCMNVWGAGGGGGYGWVSGTYTGGGGGGGGGYSYQCFAVSPFTSYAVTVGVGGTSGNTNTQSSNGGNSSVGGLISAGGGVGGWGSGGYGSPYSDGGAGGTGTNSGSNGANGTSSGGAGGNGGGGGGNGGTGGVGNPGTGTTGGVPGGGGGGSNYNASGGSGGNGKVIITW